MALGDFVSALPAVGAVASTLLSNSNNLHLAQEQREYDYKMWKENNAYNTPSKQVERLRAAGLNPAFAMENGALSSGISSQTAGGQTASVQDFSPIVQGLRDSVDLYQQRRLQESEIRNKDSLTQSQNIRNKFQLFREWAEINNIIADSKHKGADVEYLMKRKDLIEKEINAFDKRQSYELNRIDSERKKLDEQAETERVMRDVNKRAVQQSIRLSQAQQTLLAEEAKSVRESVNQMILNGASQREVNRFISDRERETARKLYKDNETYQSRFLQDMSESQSRTAKNYREHRTNSFTFFGIPLGTRETIDDFTPNSSG